ncbi:hypothetical protein [Nocardia seriolae]|uniref:XRE family transcriptional regulator n=1 Tax=Nocardia seriolae TaxID=37332 RepID=A0ABC9Z588_9NOCA|nr:hypothetical protein [Nocardia seriolae]APA97072.1 hypothetical protein NS506_03015 [Nocardia seriolae]MTJ71227.1 hypothetical protein [Nocardia seriolae]MTJ86947.1 hypothetical protein [Nocardia seriolae]MTK30942.1 hypothetical protein [Nocardia seriolae]MTK47515.1 hypothetical protein [Nocardia seriolae]
MSEPEIRLQPWETLFEEFNAQQYGMSLDTAAKAIGKSPRAAGKLARRLKKAGRAHVARIDYGSPGPWRRSTTFDDPGDVPHGPLWIFPTREIAWGYLEFDPGEWRPKASTAAHLTAVTELRLALTGMDTDPRVWTSERLLRRRLKSETGRFEVHMHDGWIRDFRDVDDVWAVEVELSRKYGQGRLTRALSAALDAAERCELAGVLYFARGTGLCRALENAATRLAHQRGLDQLSNLEIHDLDTTLARKGVR